VRLDKYYEGVQCSCDGVMPEEDVEDMATEIHEEVRERECLCVCVCLNCMICVAQSPENECVAVQKVPCIETQVVTSSVSGKLGRVMS
jgi:hypothetical protein